MSVWLQLLERADNHTHADLAWLRMADWTVTTPSQASDQVDEALRLTRHPATAHHASKYDQPGTPAKPKERNWWRM